MARNAMFVRQYFKFVIIPFLIFLASHVHASEALQLATTYKSEVQIKDYLISEKLDGVRGRWDGQQMWTKQGNKINTPIWFIKNFPSEPLDGELWIGREQFETVSGAVRRIKPPEHVWKNIKFMVFDVPLHKGTFKQRYNYAKTQFAGVSPYLKVVEQFRVKDNQALMTELNQKVRAGAEGLMLHKASSLYRDGRNPDLLKLKQYQDAEAKVVAYIEGKGRFKGMLGSLLVEMPNGTRFKIGSGFSVEERKNPPKIGSVITYKYFGFTANKKPRFASFLRVRFPENSTMQATETNDNTH